MNILRRIVSNIVNNEGYLSPFDYFDPTVNVFKSMGIADNYYEGAVMYYQPFYSMRQFWHMKFFIYLEQEIFIGIKILELIHWIIRN